VSLPVQPEPATILRAAIRTLNDVVVPDLTGEWERVCGTMVADSLQYALDLLADDRAPARRQQLALAVESLRPVVVASGAEEALAALEQASPFEAASRLLIHAQGVPGPGSDAIRATLHPVLMQQLDVEFDAALGLVRSLGAAMRGRDD
jgi:hypothetical protein